MLILAAVWGRVWAVLRLIPIWAWIVALALIWGGWQAHRARVVATEFSTAKAQAASERAVAIAAAASETSRRIAAQVKVAKDAEQAASQARADAVLATGAARRLRERVIALVTTGNTVDPTAAGASAPAGDAARVLADVLGQCVDRVGLLARVADDRGIAGAACERAYDALTEASK